MSKEPPKMTRAAPATHSWAARKAAAAPEIRKPMTVRALA